MFTFNNNEISSVVQQWFYGKLMSAGNNIKVYELTDTFIRSGFFPQYVLIKVANTKFDENLSGGRRADTRVYTEERQTEMKNPVGFFFRDLC